MKHTLIRTVPDEAEAEGFSGCSHGPIPAARRAANAAPIFVNGVAIQETEIAQEAQNHSAASGAEARAAAARALVIRELLLQRAREVGLAPASVRDESGCEETADESLVRQLLELEAPAQTPTEQECRRVYAISAQRFRIPELYEAAHILIAPADAGAAAWADAEAQARRLIGEIATSGEFARLAAAWSACPSATQGGAFGQLRRGDLAPELEEVLLALPEGAVAPMPIRTRYGWHVVRLERRTPAKIAPFEAVRELIRAALQARASVAASAKYLRTLAAGAEIEGLKLEFGAAE
jgi:peptidyl-prolyl cis-trans isomerase C